MNDWVRLSEKDQVVIALRPLASGESIQLEDDQILVVQEDISSGHKILTASVKAGQSIYKFGYSIGKAKTDIPLGSWVHTHNLVTGLGPILNYSYEPDRATKHEPMNDVRTFQGMSDLIVKLVFVTRYGSLIRLDV